MVTRQPHHEDVDPVDGDAADDENRTSPEGPCGDVAAYVLGVLDPAQHVIFSRHLAGCESCQRDAADFGMFAPVLRQAVSRPVGHPPCRLTRSILVVAAGVVVAVAAVLSVAESWSSDLDDPVEIGNLTRAEPARGEPFPLFWQI
ncbi:zf-HC2 domain-containing protein [Lentzea sp. BCCO 10_0856]|uniref:Zf-HC2 domain-containing protein n=1 Tax=Lentzea miocenica TaxID=3095431 RepID=A0ABU4SUI7_9PSEU|nr:zf-HC2 domain-containing protein [Lentzea sp. BCCO 10_0856]MDX8029576.1 zf-HC2 domain-containing protein [Lentzea sp. BCCO 10_0856]